MTPAAAPAAERAWPLLPELPESTATPVHVLGQAGAVDLDSSPLLPASEADDTGINLPRRSEHQISVLQPTDDTHQRGEG